jgi:GT2 family glycosyltransferase
VVNNGSEAGIHNALRHMPNVTILKSKKNSPCAARNEALKEMQPCDFVYFCDDDIVVSHNIIDQFCNLHAIIGEAAYNFSTYGIRRIDQVKFINKLQSKSKYDRIAYLSGGNCIISYEVAKEIQWPDSYLGYAHAEDLRFANKIRRNGHSIICLNEVKVTHLGDLRKRTYQDMLKELLGILIFSTEYKKFYIHQRISLLVKLVLKCIIHSGLMETYKFLMQVKMVIFVANHEELIDFYNER